jgi:hypothetical protein
VQDLDESPIHRKKDVIRYFATQAEGEPVIRAERVASKRVIGEKYEIWDVETDQEKWWVITPLTNLYSQADFPSMDVALTYHIGLRVRLVNRTDPGVNEKQLNRTVVSWRKWERAVEALSEAEEAEDFQAVGMRLRECLLAFVKESWKPAWASTADPSPKRGDFVNWVKIMASICAPGDSASRLRAYIFETSRTCWELVQWLTHANNASRMDADIALHAVNQVLGTLTFALIRHERGEPAHCPRCFSYQLFAECRPELDSEVSLCELCGWEDVATSRQ